MCGRRLDFHNLYMIFYRGCGSGTYNIWRELERFTNNLMHEQCWPRASLYLAVKELCTDPLTNVYVLYKLSLVYVLDYFIGWSHSAFGKDVLLIICNANTTN